MIPLALGALPINWRVSLAPSTLSDTSRAYNCISIDQY